MHTIYLNLILISGLLARTVIIKCPSNCKCDSFEKLRRANCSFQRLVMLEASIPPETELLDLSYNQISHLDDHIFSEEKLISLKLLNISHNKVSQIHMNAFIGLNSLRSLDLTENALQYLLINWFWNLDSLEELYLRGNSFGRFSDEPLIESKTLKILDLSKCAISHFGTDSFLKVPNLEVLNLDENNLIQLHVSVVKPLQNLIKLKVDKNSFSCNDLMEDLTAYCTKKGIRYDDPCKSNDTFMGNQFERIVAANNDEDDEKNSWIFDDESIENKVTECNNMNGSITNSDNNDNLLMRIINLSPVLSICIPFVYGIAIGILIGCTVQINAKRPQNSSSMNGSKNGNVFKNRRSKTWTHNTLTRKKRNGEACVSLVLSEYDLSQSTPVSPRKKNSEEFQEF